MRDVHLQVKLSFSFHVANLAYSASTYLSHKQDIVFTSCAFIQISVCLADLQLKPYRTDEFLHKLFYETSRFSAFNHQWVIKARINNSQREPALSSEREMTYQVTLVGA